MDNAMLACKIKEEGCESEATRYYEDWQGEMIVACYRCSRENEYEPETGCGEIFHDLREWDLKALSEPHLKPS